MCGVSMHGRKEQESLFSSSSFLPSFPGEIFSLLFAHHSIRDFLFIFSPLLSPHHHTRYIFSSSDSSFLLNLNFLQLTRVESSRISSSSTLAALCIWRISRGVAKQRRVFLPFIILITELRVFLVYVECSVVGCCIQRSG